MAIVELGEGEQEVLCSSVPPGLLQAAVKPAESKSHFLLNVFGEDLRIRGDIAYIVKSRFYSFLP